MALYLVAIIAPPEINEKVLEWKQYMHQHFGCKVALRSPAHITLVPPFNIETARENTLLQALSYCSSQQEPFDIALRNFAAFKPRVIYVDVVPNEPLSRLKREMDSCLSDNQYPIKIEQRPFHPHVTIANRDLKREDFNDAWNYFQGIKYEASFVVTKVSLLRSEKDGWRILER